MLSIQSSERKCERKREENDCCICLLPGCHCLIVTRYLIYLFSEVELRRGNNSLHDAKKASSTFLWSLNCYKCRCYFQSTNVGKLDMKCFL